MFLSTLVSLSIFASAEPSAQRLSEIKETAGAITRESLFWNVTTRNNDQLPSPAGSYRLHDGTFLIEFNPTIFNTLSEAGRNFITYHELGHIRIGHVSLPFPGADAAKELEFEADAFAMFIYKNLNGIDDGLLEFLNFIEARTGTVPTGPARAALCRSLID